MNKMGKRNKKKNGAGGGWKDDGRRVGYGCCVTLARVRGGPSVQKQQNQRARGGFGLMRSKTAGGATEKQEAKPMDREEQGKEMMKMGGR
jgi:hypothetical protein